jgi:hypothetical protein
MFSTLSPHYCSGTAFLQIVDLHDEQLGQKLLAAEIRNSFILATRVCVNFNTSFFQRALFSLIYYVPYMLQDNMAVYDRRSVFSFCRLLGSV